MEDIEYDLTLDGDELYYKNRERWLEYHRNADELVAMQSDDEFIEARYRAPTRKGLEAMKKVRAMLDYQKGNTSDVKKD